MIRDGLRALYSTLETEAVGSALSADSTNSNDSHLRNGSPGSPAEAGHPGPGEQTTCTH